MTRRTLWLGGAAVMVALGAAGVVATGGADDARTGADARVPTTETVQEGALAEQVSLEGILTYRAQADGSTYRAINHAHGIYTQLPTAGDRKGCGSVLYRVDDHPVLLLCGSIPAYRDLDVGDRGNDVRQLNRSLHTLGYDRGARLSPRSRAFTSRTAAALRALRRAKGVRVTGALDLDDAVVLPRAARIAKVIGNLGGLARPGGPVVEATADILEVHVELEAAQQRSIKPGDRAQITLPGPRAVRGTVDRLGSVARTGDDDGAPAAATIPAFIRLDQPARARGFDQAPVRVDVTTKGVDRALSVPVTALVGQAGGETAVEVVDGGGARALVGVKLGLFDTSAGRVAVEGALRAGDRVVVPAP